VIEKIQTGVIGSHRKTFTWAKWKEGKGKKVQYLISKWIIYSKTLGGGSHNPAFCIIEYYMESWDMPEPSSGVKGRDRVREEVDYKTITKDE
jgi:hypothetical protein